MPLINITTSTNVADKKDLLKKSTKLISKLTNKSEKFVMAKVDDCVEMYFSNDNKQCCFVEIKSIGSLNPSAITMQICEFICSEIGIPIDRIYLNFENVPSTMWGWNGKTFG